MTSLSKFNLLSPVIGSQFLHDMGQCCSRMDSTEIISNPNWMAELPSDLHDVPLHNLSIPGRVFLQALLVHCIVFA